MTSRYPATLHLDGSRGRPGVRLRDVEAGTLVWEEKLDGGHVRVSFDADGNLSLLARDEPLPPDAASRGRYAPFVAWAEARTDALFDRLGDRYEAHLEDLSHKRTAFYDALPDRVLEFDVLDRDTGAWLDTPSRNAMWAGTPVLSVPVVHLGDPGRGGPASLVAPSAFKGPAWRESLRAAAEAAGADPDAEEALTDMSDEGEGLYAKAEAGGRVLARYKYVRPGFLAALLASGSHHGSRRRVPNGVVTRPGSDISATPSF